jgi:hypothetical protein
VSAVTSPAADGEGDRGPRRAVRVPTAALVPCLPGAHAGVPTTVDERSRRLSHEELTVAAQLAAEGHRVRSVPERRGQGPVADLEVCGARVEVKSFLPLAERDRAPTSRSVCNKLLSAREQAPTTVVLAQGSGLSEGAARAGLEEFVGRGRPGRTAGVRIIGDDFDLSWATGRVRVTGRDRGRGLDGPGLAG